MKFFTETTITGDLILIKTNIPTPPPCPIIARNVKPADAWFIRLILWLVAQFAPLIAHWPPPIWTVNKARFAVLAIVGMALIEVLAENHIERVLGMT